MCNGEKLMSELEIPVVPVYVLTGGTLFETGCDVLDASVKWEDLLDRFHMETRDFVYDAVTIEQYPGGESIVSWVTGYPMIYNPEVFGG